MNSAIEDFLNLVLVVAFNFNWGEVWWVLVANDISMIEDELGGIENWVNAHLGRQLQMESDQSCYQHSRSRTSFSLLSPFLALPGPDPCFPMTVSTLSLCLLHLSDSL